MLLKFGEVMSKKKEFEKVYDPVEKKVHISESGFLDQVTLCGQTDWIGNDKVEYNTDKAINCNACLEIVRIVRSHSDPRNIKLMIRKDLNGGMSE